MNMAFFPGRSGGLDWPFFFLFCSLDTIDRNGSIGREIGLADLAGRNGREWVDRCMFFTKRMIVVGGLLYMLAKKYIFSLCGMGIPCGLGLS